MKEYSLAGLEGLRWENRMRRVSPEEGREGERGREGGRDGRRGQFRRQNEKGI